MSTQARIQYNIAAHVEGQDSVRSLEKELDNLAQTLDGELKTQAQESAQALRQLGQQQAAIETLRSAARAMRETHREWRAYDTAVKQAAVAVKQSGAHLQTLSSTAHTAQQHLQQLRKEQDRLAGEHKKAAQAAKRAGAGNTELARAADLARERIQQHKQAVAQQQQAVQQANRALKTAQGEHRKLVQALKDSQGAVARSNIAYTDSRTALRNARREAANYGVDLGNLGQAEHRLTEQIKAGLQTGRARVQSLQEQALAQRQAADAATATGQKLNDAFATVGVRSARAIRAEIRQVKESLKLVQQKGHVTGKALEQAHASAAAKVRELERELRQVQGRLTLADRAARLFGGSIGQIFAGNFLANAAMTLVGQIAGLGQRFVQAAVDGERLSKSMQAIYKDSGLVNKQIGFVRRLANEAGVEVRSLTQQFTSFAASTRQAGIDIKVSNDLFASVTRAAATLGLGSDRTALALQALSQMASKGTVAMEELRGQLGESLPGALGLTAKGLGITEQELIKLVGSGGLAARDLFPALAAALKEMHGDTNTLAGGWARLQNIVTGALQQMADSGGIRVMTATLKLMTGVVGTLVAGLQTAVEAVFALGRGFAAVFAAIKTRSIAPLKAYFEELGEAGKRVTGTLRAAWGGATTAVQQHTQAVEQSAQAANTSRQSWVSLGSTLAKQQDTYKNAIATLSMALLKEAEAYTFSKHRKNKGISSTALSNQRTKEDSTPTHITPPSTATTQPIQTIRIELPNGQSAEVLSGSGAQALIDVLKAGKAATGRNW